MIHISNRAQADSMTSMNGDLDDIERFLHRRNGAYDQISEGLSSYQRTLIFVAADLIRREIGSRVPGKLEYARQIGVGVGTVHKALNYLETPAIQLIFGWLHQRQSLFSEETFMPTLNKNVSSAHPLYNK